MARRAGKRFIIFCDITVDEGDKRKRQNLKKNKGSSASGIPSHYEEILSFYITRKHLIADIMPDISRKIIKSSYKA